VKARTHEPAGLVIRESIQVIEVLEMFYQMTGDRHYLKPIPGCLAWFDRINREALDLKRFPARYYELGTNLPIYNLKTNKTNAEGYGLYRWSNTDAQGDGEGLFRFGAGPPQIRPVVDVAPLRKEYERIDALAPSEARAEYQKRHRGWSSGEDNPRPGRRASVNEIISAMDPRGAWLGDVRVLTVIPRSQGINPGTFEMIRGYSTAVFVRNLRALIDYSIRVE
jgi:hypothetical protein